MITGADLKRDKYNQEGGMMELGSGGWRIWFRCEQFPRLTRRDELQTLNHPVTQTWFVDGVECPGMDDAIRQLMKPAPKQTTKETAAPTRDRAREVRWRA